MFVVILLLVLCPFVEIAVFLQVVSWIGVLNTLAVMVRHLDLVAPGW